jgi:hypothetical protein
MTSKQYAVLIAFAAIFVLTSCSGVKNSCTVNCGGGNGDASVRLNLAAVPLTPPPGTSILSFAVTINSVSLTPASGGSDVNIPLNTGTYSVDLTRLQSDSSFLGQAVSGVPSGTYNQLSVNASAVVTYCTATSGTPGCNPGSVAQISKSFATPTTSNFSLALAANQQAGLRVLINFTKALTVNSGTQAVTGLNLTAANVLTTTTLPPGLSTLSAGQLDYIDDATGVVTAASGTSVTVLTATRGSITSVITNSTISSPTCVIQNNPCVATVGQIASLDSALNSDGTSTLLQYDPISNKSVDVIEGIVTTSNLSNTQFEIVTNDFVLASSNSLLANNLSLGDPVNVTLAPTVSPFAIDTKGLPTVATGFDGATSATDILPGQTVALRVTSFTPRAANTPASATVDFVVLRFTRVVGNVFSAAAPDFGIQSLPVFFGQFTSNIVQTSAGSPSTYLDGYSNIGSILTGDNVAIRALYFGVTVSPSFTAAKVRKN